MRFAAVVVLALFLAGCGAPSPSPLYVDDDAGSTSTLVDPTLIPDEDGDGEPDLDTVDPAIVRVTVKAIDDGTPLAGIGVVFRIFECDWCDATLQQVGLRTDAAGQVELALYADVQVEVVAGDHTAYTTEVAPRVQSELGVEQELELRLYSTQRAYAVDDAVPLALYEAETRLYGEADQRDTWRFHDDALVHAGYMARLAHVDLDLAWNNTPLSSGWLAGFIDGGSWGYQETESPGFPATVVGHEPGAHGGTFRWQPTGDTAPEALDVGVRLRTSIVGEDLPYQLGATATFQGSQRFEVRID